MDRVKERLLPIRMLASILARVFTRAAHRQGDGESTAVTGSAGRAKMTVMKFYDLARDIQAKAKTSAGACLDLDFRNAVETFKDVRKPVWRNTHAMIDHGDERLIAQAFNTHDDGSALRRVFARVGKQVEQDLADTLPVHLDLQLWMQALQLKRRADLFAILIQHFPAERYQITGLVMQRKEAGIVQRGC